MKSIFYIKNITIFVKLGSGAIGKRLIFIASAISIEPLLMRNAPRIVLNRGFLLGLNPANQTCKTTLLGSCKHLYLTKLREIKIFQRAFSFLSFDFL